MVVEASEGGGAGGELLAWSELEMKKEREMGGEIEHITCRVGEDNDWSRTGGSFVMVMNGGDSDARSDLSEKDMGMDAGGGGRGAGDLLAANSESSTFVEDVRVDEGKGDKGLEREGNEDEEELKLGETSSVDNEGKGEDMGGGEDNGEESEKIVAMPVEPEEVIEPKEEVVVVFEASTNEEEHEEKETVVVEVSNDGVQNQLEEGLVVVEDSKDEKVAAIEELDNEEEVVDVKAVKNEEQNQVGEEVVIVEDSQNENEAFIDDLNNEDEAIAIQILNDEQNQVEEEVVIVEDSKNVKQTVIEDLNEVDEAIMGSREQVSEGTKAPFVQNEVRSDNEGLTIGASSPQLSSSDPVDSIIELESVIEKSEVVESSFAKKVNMEVESDSEIEETKKACEQKSGDVDSSITEKKEAGSASENEERRDVNDDVGKEIDSSDLAKEEISSVFEIEDRRDDNQEECGDADYSDRKALKEAVDANSEIEESKNTNDEGSKDVESEISAHMDEEVDSASEVGDMKIAHDDLSNCVDWENKKKTVIQEDKNLQIEGTPAVSDDENGELKSSVEQAKQKFVNPSLSNSEIEEKEHDSYIELIAEPVKENSGSASIVEEYQAAEVSSIGQSTEPALELISSASRAEDEYDEGFSTSSNPEPFNKERVSAPEAEEDKKAEMSFNVSNSVPREDMDVSTKVEVKHDLDVSFIYLDAEPTSTSEVEEIQYADTSPIDSVPEPVKEDGDSVSKSEENQVAETLLTEGETEKEDLKSATEFADVVTQPVNDLEGTEEQGKDLKTEEQDVEGLMAEFVNKKRDLKSATELTEHKKIHLDKDLGDIEEQQKDLKSDDKHDVVNIQQKQGNATSSAPDGDGEKIDMHSKKYRIIKVPRFTQRVINDELQAKITDAQVHVDEHTRSRDSLKLELNNMRKVLSDCFHKRDSANEEEKKAKALVNAKRLEMDSIQTVISKGRTAASFLDIISQIHTLEHKIQHETISLKDEKNYLHELNQLKHERELHLFNKCSQLEIDEALKQKETAESSLRALKKEFDMLRSAHLKADEYSKAANKSYIDQFNKVKEHEQKWKSSNELRQNAYKNLHGLKSDKMEHYWKYLEDRQAAKKYASSGDIEALEHHCMEQVERIMRLWNEDDDFRRQYVESNVNNTLRKFGTLDGRTPGPNDAKIVLPLRASPSLTTRSSPAHVTVRKEQEVHAHEATKPALPTNQTMRSTLPSKTTLIKVATAVIAPSREDSEEVEVEKKLTMEEEEKARLAEEQARKEEELRKERVALESKEMLRMEQKAKAKEAEERKRRKTEKAQARAEYRAQKEAELRELKRAKKEKKKDGTSEKAGSVDGDPAPVTDTSSQEASQERESNNRTTSKRSRRQSAAALNKYSNKVQPVPLPLRNKGKRKMSTWIWTLCVAVALVGLFFAGNYISFSDFSSLKVGF